MTNLRKEGEVFLPQSHRFQAVIGRKEPERSPLIIAGQTNTLLGLYHQGAIHRPGLAREYLGEYALKYLNMAEQGAEAVFDRTDKVVIELDEDVVEAADHANVVFAHLPDLVKSPWLPQGFSRRGVLRPPETVRQFRGRIREIKVGIGQVVAGDMEPRATLEAYPNLLRTLGFFKVGSELSIRVPESERAAQAVEREKFNDLLSGIDISFG